MIDEKKLIEFIKSNDFKRRIIQSKDSLQDTLIQFITEQSTAGEWIPANQPPNILDEHQNSEDLLIKLKWDDGDVTYCVGFYNKKYGWSEDSQCTETIAWKPLSWMKLSELYQPEGGKV